MIISMSDINCHNEHVEPNCCNSKIDFTCYASIMFNASTHPTTLIMQAQYPQA